MRANARDVGSIPGVGRSPEAEIKPSRALGWKSPWSEEPGGLKSMRKSRVRHNWTEHSSSQVAQSNTAWRLSVLGTRVALPLYHSDTCQPGKLSHLHRDHSARKVITSGSLDRTESHHHNEQPLPATLELPVPEIIISELSNHKFAALQKGRASPGISSRNSSSSSSKTAPHLKSPAFWGSAM